MAGTRTSKKMLDKGSETHESPNDRTGLRRVAHVAWCLIYSRYLAAAVIAFAVSWGFHLVEKQTDEKLLHQDNVITCVIEQAHGQIKTNSKVSRTDKLFRICERKVTDRYEK